MPPEPFGAHFLVGSFDVFTISEFDRVAAEHFPRQVSQDRFGAGADLNQDSLGIRHQDQVLGRSEDAAAILAPPSPGAPVAPPRWSIAIPEPSVTRTSRWVLSLQLRRSCFFFFNDTATTEIYTLSLHDALPISRRIFRRLHDK